MADSQRKTANLFDGDVEQGTWNAQITPIVKADSSVRCRVSNFIDVAENTQYTISLVNAISGLQIIVVYVDDNYSRLSETTWLSLPITFNTPTNCKYVEAIFRKSDNANIIPSECGNMMLNSGSTPLPYVPYWQHSLRKLTTATEAVENPLYSDGTAITNYTIKGNTVQDGTPTPSNPVDVVGVGVRTENLAPNIGWVDGFIGPNGSVIPADTVRLEKSSDFIPIQSGITLAYSYRGDSFPVGSSGVDIAWRAFGVYKSDKTFISRLAGAETSTYVVQLPDNAAYIRLSLRTYGQDTSNVMLNTGSTAKPYEPYGYKIPISNGQQTTNIYLGNTQTVRQIKKFVLTGGETSSYSTDYGVFYMQGLITDYLKQGKICVCSHFQPQNNVVSIGAVQDGISFHSGVAADRIYFKNPSFASKNEWMQYFAQQYANGSPVTVYYVLATPETATVNEPLMKIGNYSDTLSNAAQIPTIEGANSITVDTTVQPSEFTATWAGWHDASVKEWDGSQWNE